MKFHYFALVFLSFSISAIYGEEQKIDEKKSTSGLYQHDRSSSKLQKQKAASCRRKKEVRRADLPMPPPGPPEMPPDMPPPDMPPDMPPPLPPDIPAPPTIGAKAKKHSNQSAQKRMASRKKAKKNNRLSDLPMPPPQPMPPPPPTIGAKKNKSSSGSSMQKYARRKDKQKKESRMARRRKKVKRGTMRDLPLPPPGR